jgi:hypothetical protein
MLQWEPKRKLIYIYIYISDESVRKVIGYGLHDRGLIAIKDRYFSRPHHVSASCGVSPASLATQ